MRICASSTFVPSACVLMRAVIALVMFVIAVSWSPPP
jgi:hypothetical protein